MLRRRPNSHEDMAFTDVAMAVLGPITLLMIIYLISAVYLEEERDKLCLKPTPENMGTLVAGLKGWVNQIATEVDKKNAILDRKCPSLRPADNIVPINFQHFLPPQLKEVCVTEVDRVFTAAGISRSTADSIYLSKLDAEDRFFRCFADPLNRTCVSVEPRHRPEYVQKVVSWWRALERNVHAQRKILEDKCGLSMERSTKKAPVVYPDVLKDVCAEDRDQILSEAGANHAMLQDLFQKLEQNAAAIELCFGDQEGRACRNPDEAEIDSLAKKLKTFVSKEHTTAQARENSLRISCQDQEPDAIQDRAMIDHIPFSLAELCPLQMGMVLNKAGVTWQELKTLGRQREHVLQWADNCQTATSEDVSERVDTLKFIKCTTVFSRDGKEALGGGSVDKHFFDLVQNIAEKIRANKKYNRIDIFGHTDKTTFPEYSPTCSNAKDNFDLGAKRALTYREGIVKAIQMHPAFRDLKRRLEAKTGPRLRIYAVAVGPAEPLDDGDTGDAYNKNRRIEIRLVTDDRDLTR